MLDVNLVGAFNLLRLSAAAMAANDPNEDGTRGAVVLTSSVGAYEGQMGQIAYAASKGGIVTGRSDTVPASIRRRGTLETPPTPPRSSERAIPNAVEA